MMPNRRSLGGCRGALDAAIPSLERGILGCAMRSRIAALVLVAGCGPSAGTDEACTREDVVTSGRLVSGPEWEACSPCDLESSYVSITLETSCEAGVEWRGTSTLSGHTTAVNLVTGERFVLDNPLAATDLGLYRVTPDEPHVWGGDPVRWIVNEPGEYSFRVELRFELMAAEFEGTVE
jgi:hypothetical protein